MIDFPGTTSGTTRGVSGGRTWPHLTLIVIETAPLSEGAAQTHNAGVAGSSPAPAIARKRAQRPARHRVEAFARSLFALPLHVSGTMGGTTGPERRRRVLDRRGYVRVYGLPGGWEYEHRLIAAAMLGRSLEPSESVHHRNEVRTDNWPTNLEVMPAGAHVGHHNRMAPKRRRAS